jgi:quercetin dioxygenase-like cupin family protein
MNDDSYRYYAAKLKAGSMPAAPGPIGVTRLVRAGHGTKFELGGPVVELLILSDRGGYWVMKEELPPNVSVPLHSHDDEESFYVLSGEAQVLMQTKAGFEWRSLTKGDFAHIPSGAKHAWRNLQSCRAEMLLTTTPKLGRFLCEMGEFARNGGGPGLAEKLHYLSQRYGYWLGSPQENAGL